MYIAMNRFKVEPGAEKDFEQVWITREVNLHKEPGFISFHLLRGPTKEDHVLYSSHTVWRSFADFEAWTKSELVPEIAFRRRHHEKALSRPSGIRRFRSHSRSRFRRHEVGHGGGRVSR